jgi:hypothetical protein
VYPRQKHYLLVQKAYGNDDLNRSNVFRWYSQFRDGRELLKDDERDGCPKLTTWGKHLCIYWFGQKWPSNRIKNDSRFSEHSQDCSSLDSERGFGKEKVVCTFCFTLLDIWAKWRLSHILPRHCDGWCKQIFLTKLLREIKPGVLHTAPRQSDKESWMGWRDISSAEERFCIKTMLIFLTKEFVPEGKAVNAEFYKGLIDFLNCIQQCSAVKICSCCMIMCLPTKLQVCQFFTQKCYTLSPPNLQIYLCQAIFSFRSWKLI